MKYIMYERTKPIDKPKLWILLALFDVPLYALVVDIA